MTKNIENRVEPIYVWKNYINNRLEKSLIDLNSMDKDKYEVQEVIVHDNGGIEILSRKGRYFNNGGPNEEHSCVISDNFVIDSKSVRNLMILFSKKDPVLKCISVDNYKNGWIYVNSNSVVADLIKENNELKNKLYDTEKELNHTKILMNSFETSLDRTKNELEKEKTKKWWEKLFKRE
jgi:hypothetical protein